MDLPAGPPDYHFAVASERAPEQVVSVTPPYEGREVGCPVEGDLRDLSDDILIIQLINLDNKPHHRRVQVRLPEGHQEVEVGAIGAEWHVTKPSIAKHGVPRIPPRSICPHQGAALIDAVRLPHTPTTDNHRSFVEELKGAQLGTAVSDQKEVSMAA